MAEITISQAALDDLAKKLDSLDLSTEQKELLSAIVAAAAEAVTVQVADSAPTFREQFATAFTPGQATLVVKISHITRTTP
jgi:hypothetical protein